MNLIMWWRFRLHEVDSVASAKISNLLAANGESVSLPNIDGLLERLWRMP